MQHLTCAPVETAHMSCMLHRGLGCAWGVLGVCLGCHPVNCRYLKLLCYALHLSQFLELPSKDDLIPRQILLSFSQRQLALAQLLSLELQVCVQLTAQQRAYLVLHHMYVIIVIHQLYTDCTQSQQGHNNCQLS